MKDKTAATMQTYDLVKGSFSPDEALELLNDILYLKINFNKQKRVSQEVRFGKHDALIDRRIDELRASLHEIQNTVEQAKAAGKTFRIQSTISIEVL